MKSFNLKGQKKLSPKSFLKKWEYHIIWIDNTSQSLKFYKLTISRSNHQRWQTQYSMTGFLTITSLIWYKNTSRYRFINCELSLKFIICQELTWLCTYILRNSHLSQNILRKTPLKFSIYHCHIASIKCQCLYTMLLFLIKLVTYNMVTVYWHKGHKVNERYFHSKKILDSNFP